MCDTLHDDTLPCLQAVGPWWTEADRRTLFCFLTEIFGLSSNYLASLPAAEYEVSGTRHRLSDNDILSEYYAYLRTKTKNASCPKIRKHEFSFGKINSKLCYLCPYNSLYKNLSMKEEYRFIYYLMKNSALSLSDIVDKDTEKMSDYFLSYFPAYKGELMIEAFPFSLIADAFLELEAGEYVRDPKVAKKKVVEHVKRALPAKTNYMRTKEYLIKDYPDYEESLLLSADRVLSYLEEVNRETRGTVYPSMIKRLLEILKVHRKYKPLSVSDYMIEKTSLLEPELFKSTIPDFFNEVDVEKDLSGDAQSMKGSLEDNAALPLPDKDTKLEDNKQESSKRLHFEDEVNEEDTELKKASKDDGFTNSSVLPENPLSEFEDEYFRSLRTMDDDPFLLRPYTMPNYDTKRYSAFGMPDVQSHTSDNNNESFEDVKPINEQAEAALSDNVLSEFRELYDISGEEDVYVYGATDMENDDAIIDVLMHDVPYLCMEPAISGGVKGVIIAGPMGDKIFYSVSHYGPRPLRKLSFRKIPVYTSNRYHLCRYLYKNRVFKLDVKDVGAAISIQRGCSIKGIAEMTADVFPKCMDKYAQLFEQAISFFTDKDMERLERYEKLSSILCSDGNRPPFSQIEGLCKVNGSLDYEFLYKVEMPPTLSGLFVFLRAGSSCEIKKGLNYYDLYVDTCIELDNLVSFTNGNLHLLKITESGMLIYITGHHISIRMIHLYLSGCARRCFSSAAENRKTMSIEERTHSHGLNGAYSFY